MKAMISLFLLLLSIGTYGQSQITAVGKNGKSWGGGNMSGYNTMFSNPYIREYNNYLEKDNNVKGSRWVYDSFAQKGLLFINDVTYTTYGINIDVVNNDIVTLIGKDSILVLDKTKIDSLRINNKDFKKFDGNTFYEVLNSGKKLALVKDYQGKIVEGYENVMKGTKDKDKYVITTRYLIKSGNEFEKLETSKKKIIGQLSDHESEIEKYIKDNELTVKSDEDLAKIFEYYNSL